MEILRRNIELITCHLYLQRKLEVTSTLFKWSSHRNLWTIIYQSLDIFPQVARSIIKDNKGWAQHLSLSVGIHFKLCHLGEGEKSISWWWLNDVVWDSSNGLSSKCKKHLRQSELQISPYFCIFLAYFCCQTVFWFHFSNCADTRDPEKQHSPTNRNKFTSLFTKKSSAAEVSIFELPQGDDEVYFLRGVRLNHVKHVAKYLLCP